MDERRGSGRLKRQKIPDEGSWDCSVCTYKNSPEAYKCEMCDVRKGTSTRKPRLNAQLVAQQVAQQYVPPPPKKEKSGFLMNGHGENSNDLDLENDLEHDLDEEDDEEESSRESAVLTANRINIKAENNHTHSSEKPKKVKSRRPKLRNVDRRNEQHMAVTVGNVTVVITDYQPNVERQTSTETPSNMLSDHSDTSSTSGVSNDGIDAPEEILTDTSNT